MAEVIAKSLVKDDNITFSSMGISGLIGYSADKSAIEVCKEINLDLSNHIARELNMKELNNAEKIYCMDRGHLEFISSISQEISDKALLFTDGVKPKIFKRDIKDPYRKSLRVFRKSREIIYSQLELILPTLY